MNFGHLFTIVRKFWRHAVDAGRVVMETTRPTTCKAAAVPDYTFLGTRAARVFRLRIPRSRRRGRVSADFRHRAHCFGVSVVFVDVVTGIVASKIADVVTGDVASEVVIGKVVSGDAKS